MRMAFMLLFDGKKFNTGIITNLCVMYMEVRELLRVITNS